MKTTVTLQKLTVAYDDARIAAKTWVDVAQLAGVMLPVKQDIRQTDSGINVDVGYQFFTKQANSELKPGNRLVSGDKKLMISAVLDYKKIRQVELRDDV